jgi:hypothetical protein
MYILGVGTIYLLGGFMDKIGGSSRFFYFRSCCGPLLHHLLLRSVAEAAVLLPAFKLGCYWLHNDSASRTAPHPHRKMVMLRQVEVWLKNPQPL